MRFFFLFDFASQSASSLQELWTAPPVGAGDGAGVCAAVVVVVVVVSPVGAGDGAGVGASDGAGVGAAESAAVVVVAVASAPGDAHAPQFVSEDLPKVLEKMKQKG